MNNTKYTENDSCFGGKYFSLFIVLTRIFCSYLVLNIIIIIFIKLNDIYFLIFEKTNIKIRYKNIRTFITSRYYTSENLNK